MSVITRSNCASGMRLESRRVAVANHHVVVKRIRVLLEFAARVSGAKPAALAVNVANEARGAQRRKIRFDGALLNAVAINVARRAVKVGEPFVSWASGERTRINRGIRSRRGTTATNQQSSNQHVTHSAIVHDVADTCAAIGKAVQL